MLFFFGTNCYGIVTITDTIRLLLLLAEKVSLEAAISSASIRQTEYNGVPLAPWPQLRAGAFIAIRKRAAFHPTTELSLAALVMAASDPI